MKSVSNYFVLIWMSLNLIFPYPVFSLPQNGSVVSGQVDIQQSVNRLNVYQQTQKAIVHWDRFSIGSEEMVRFIQPGLNSAILNRVTGLHPSLIEGVMNANGNVFLINPNGILIGPSGVIQAHNFLGSTLDIANKDFLDDSYTFTLKPGAPIGNIINRGIIQANDSGSISLLSPDIRNHGTIMAHMGKIHLAAGEKITMSFIENELVGFAINPEDLPESSSNPAHSRIDNFGNIQSEGGEILLSAKTASDMVHAVVNNEGIIEAHSLVNDNGIIRLDSSDEITNSGIIDVSGKQATEKGGNIEVSSETIIMTDTATLDASGHNGGGHIWIGGGLRGTDDTIPNAQHTYMGHDTTIKADALNNGNGGQVVVWGDQTTQFFGDISAKGGMHSGDGGFVEVSGKQNLLFDGSVSTRASKGKNGTLLLDPQKIYILDGDSDDLDDQFNGTINFTDIPDDLTISETRLESLSSETDIVLQANDSITIASLKDNELTLNQTGSVEMHTGKGGFAMNPTDTINIVGGGHLLIDALGSENNAYPATDGPVLLGTIRTALLGNVTIQGTKITLAGPISAGGTVSIENRQELIISKDISVGDSFIQKGYHNVYLGGDISATDEISFTHNNTNNKITLTTDTTRLASRSGNIYLMNSKIVEENPNSALLLNAESVVSLGDLDITQLIFEDMNGGLILNGDVHLVSSFDTTPIAGLLYVDKESKIQTYSQKVVFNNALTLKAPLTIHTGDGLGDITFKDRINGQFDMELTAGTGNISFYQDVGKNSFINKLTIVSANNVTLMDDLLTDGAIEINYSSLLSQGGAIRTTGDHILLNGHVLLTGDAEYDTGTGGGDIYISGNVNSQNALDQDIFMTAGTGNINIDGAVGNSTIPGDVHILSANNVSINGIFQANSLLHPSGTGNITFLDSVTTYDGGIHLHGQKMLLNGMLNSNNSPIILAADAFQLPEEIRALDSSVTLYPHSSDFRMGVEDYSCDLNITNTQLHALKTNQIILGHVDNTAGMSIAIDNTISQNKQLQFISSGPITIQGTIVTGNNSKLIITNYDDLTISPGAILTLDGGWLQEGDGQVYIGGSMTTTNDDILFNGPVRLTGNLALDTGLSSGDIQFLGKLDGNYYLSAKSGQGSIGLGGQVGAEIPLNGLSLTSSADIEIANLFHAGSMTITNNGTLRFTSGADIQLDNAFLQQGIGPVELAGKITTKNENITFTQPVTLIGNATLNTDTGPGNILFNNTVNGLHILTMSAGTGDIEMVDTVGNHLNPIHGLLIQSGRNVTFLSDIIVGQESIDITAQNISIVAPVTTQNGGLLAFENSNLLSLSENAILDLDGAFWQRSTGEVQLSTDIITTGDEIKIEGPLSFTRDIRMDTGSESDGNIFLGGNVTSIYKLTLSSGSGDVTLDQSVSTEGVKVESSDTLTINGDIQVRASGLDLNSNNVSINNNIQTTENGNIVISNEQDLNIAADTQLTLDGFFKQTGNGWVNVGATIQTTGDDIVMDGNLTLLGPVQLTTGQESGHILLEGTIDSSKDCIYGLSLNSGTGNIIFHQELGINDLFDLTILSSQNVVFNASSKLNTFTQESGTGLTHFKDTLYLGTGGFSFIGNQLSFDKNIDSDHMATNIGMHITNEDLLTIAPLSEITLSGDFTQDGSGNISLGGAIQTFSSNITIAGALLLSSDSGLRSANAGNVSIQKAIDGQYQLSLASGTGNLILSSAVGQDTPLIGLTVENAKNIQMNVSVNTQDNGIHLTGDSIVSSGNWISDGGDIHITGHPLISGDWVTDGGDITIIGNTQLSDHIQWNTGNGPGNIQVQGQMNGTSDYEQNMLFRAGTGNISFQDSIGSQTPIGNIQIQSATHVTAKSTIDADAFKQIATDGQTQLLGSVSTQTGGIQLQNKQLSIEGNLDSNGNDIVLIGDQMTLPSSIKAIDASVQFAPVSVNTPIGINHPEQTLLFDDATIDKIETSHLIFGSYLYDGSIFIGKDELSVFGQDKDLSFITNGNINIVGTLLTTHQKSVSIEHGQSLTVDADLSLDGSFSENGSGQIYWKGTLQTTGDSITFNQPIVLIGNSNWDTQSGLLTVNQTIDGIYALNVNTGTGRALFAKNVGKTSRLASLSVVSGQADMHGIQTSADGIHITADTIQLSGDLSTLQGNIILTGPTHIMSDLRMDTSGGDITFENSVLDNDLDRKMTIASGDGTISFQNVSLGTLAFELGGDLILNDDITVTNAWNTEQLAHIYLKNNITIQTQNSDITLRNAIDGHYALILDTGAENTGYVHLSGDLGGTNALKSLSVLDSAGCFIDGSILTANGNVLFKRPVLLSDHLTINTGTGIGNVRFEDVLYSAGNSSKNLQMVTGGGDITFLKAVGPNTELGNVSIQQAKSIYIYDSFRAKDIAMTPFQHIQLGGPITATDGNVTINGDMVTTQNQLHINSTNGNIAISGQIDDQNSSRTLVLNANKGKININDASMGEIQIDAADSGLYLHGDIIVNERFDSSNIAGPIILENHSSISTRQTGYIVLTPTIDGPFQLLINSNGGTVRMDRAVGMTQKVQTFIISSAETILLGDHIYTTTGKISMNGNVTLLKDNIKLHSVIGDIVLNNAVDDSDNGFQLNIISAAGNIYLDDISLKGIHLEAPNNGLYLKGDINLTDAFDTTEIDGAVTIQSPLMVQTTSQNVTFNTDIALNANLSINTGENAGSVFFNGAIDGNNQLIVSAGTGDIKFSNNVGSKEAISKLTISSGQHLGIHESIRSHGNIQLDHSGTISLYGDLQTINEGASIVISDAPATFFGNRSISTVNGNIVLDQIMPSVNDDQNVILNAGEGNISIDHAMGMADKAFADIQFINANDIHLMGAETTVHARSFIIEKSTGNVRFDGRLTLTGNLTLNVHLLQINALIKTTGSGKITIANSDEASILADIQSAGDVQFTGDGKIELDGDIDISNSGSFFMVDQAELSLRDSHHVKTNDGDIVFNDISTEKPGDNMLNLTAGSGNIQVKGAVGRPDQILGGIHVLDAGNVQFFETDKILYANTLWVQSVDGETAFHGPVRISGDIDIRTNRLSILNKMETKTGGNISIETTGNTTVQSSVISDGTIDWNQTGDLKILQNISSQGNITFSGAGKIHLNADISILGMGTQLSIDIASLLLMGDHQISTINGDILLNTILTDSPDEHILSLSAGNGNIEIKSDIGSEIARMGGLAITDANEVAFSGENASMNVNTLSIHNKDILTIKSDIRSTGKLTFSGAGNILLSADLETTGPEADISILYSNLQLMENCSIISHQGDIQLANIFPNVDSSAALQLDANNNQIFLNGKVGETGKSLSGLNIVQANHVHVNGSIHISGDIDINACLLTVNQAIETDNLGKISITVSERAGILSPMTSQGTIAFNDSGSVVLGSDIQTTTPNADIVFNNTPLILSQNSSLKTSGGHIQLASVLPQTDTSPSLTLAANSGIIDFNGQVGNADQMLSKIQIDNAQNVRMNSSAGGIYTQQLSIKETTSQTLINTPLYVSGNVLLESSTLIMNNNIQFQIQSNANLTIKTSGQSTINADLQIPGNLLFDGKGHILLASNIQTTVEAGSIKAPDATLVVSGDRQISTLLGDIELNQINALQSTDALTINPGGADVVIRGNAGTQDMPLYGLSIENAMNVSFSGPDANIFALDHLSIEAAERALFEGNASVEKNILMNVNELCIESQMIVAQDVFFDVLGDLTVMGLQTNGKGDITLISQTGQMVLGNIDAGSTGNIHLTALKSIEGGTLHAESISVNASSIGLNQAPLLDTLNFQATLTGLPDNPFIGHIRMSEPDANLPKQQQINYLGEGLSIFLIDNMTIYGLEGEDRPFYPMPVLTFKQHTLIKEAFEANRPEFFMTAPLNVDLSLEDDKEIQFLEMDYWF